MKKNVKLIGVLVAVVLCLFIMHETFLAKGTKKTENATTQVTTGENSDQNANGKDSNSKAGGSTEQTPIPTEAPKGEQEFKGTPKVDIKLISESKLEGLGFSKTQMNELVMFHGKIGNDYVAVSFRAGKATHVTVSSYDTQTDISESITHVQFSDVYDTNEIAVIDSGVVEKAPDYENQRRVVFNPDGSIQYATKPHDQSTISYYEKTCTIIKQLQ